MCHFWAQNDPFVHYHHFHLTIDPFHCAKFKKILTADLELLGCTTFGPKMVHLPQTIFSRKLFTTFLSTYWPLSLCKILKKFFQLIQSYEDAQLLGPKRPTYPNENYFRKPVNEPCFFHSCLS